MQDLPRQITAGTPMASIVSTCVLRAANSTSPRAGLLIAPCLISVNFTDGATPLRLLRFRLRLPISHAFGCPGGEAMPQQTRGSPYERCALVRAHELMAQPWGFHMRAAPRRIRLNQIRTMPTRRVPGRRPARGTVVAGADHEQEAVWSSGSAAAHDR